MKRSGFPIWVYLILVFASGAALGVFSDHLYYTKTVLAKTVAARSDPKEYRHKYVDEMRTRLKLDASQVENLNRILDDTQQAMDDFHKRQKPEMAAIHNSHVSQVRALLTTNQLAEYQKMLEERESKRRAEQK